ncbi:GGDEF domain-containing protein [Bacillus xiapuensis]|uniref:GGDEF domain-containing protein n=1 Tax=Bacillus xiapuensis TaxID=2014075 RepID=UPI000C23EBEB|nr:diguanylate cyclase [Bacillus xiapuensis]
MIIKTYHQGVWYRALFNSLVDATAILDKEGDIVDVNRSWMTFFSADETMRAGAFAGHNFLRLCDEEARNGIIQVLGGKKTSYIYEYAPPFQMDSRRFLLRATPLQQEDGGCLGAVISFTDVTKQKSAEAELQKNEQRYRMIVEHSTDFISLHSLQGVYTYVSPIGATLLGYEPEEMIGRNAYDFFHPEDIPHIRSVHQRIHFESGIQTVCYRIRHKDGHYIWFETKTQNILTAEDGEIICISRDITHYQQQLQRLEEEKQALKSKVYVDELTKIYNRRYFQKRLRIEEREAIQSGLPLSLLLIDVDYFKQYNDTYGHQKGDDCLITVAQTLHKNVRAQDSACRIGGEEFAVILPSTRKEEALLLANRLRQKVQEMQIEHLVSPVTSHVTISVGGSTWDGSLGKVDELFNQADQALYRAKRAGRNQVRYE